MSKKLTGNLLKLVTIFLRDGAVDMERCQELVGNQHSGGITHIN